MTNLADRLRAHATGFVHAHATERLLIEAAEALTPSQDHADLIGRLEAIAKSPDAKAVLLVRWNEPTGDPDWTPFGASETLSSKLLETVAAIRALTASLSRVEGALLIAATRLDVAATRSDRADTEFGIRQWADEARTVAQERCLSRASADQTDGGDGL